MAHGRWLIGRVLNPQSAIRNTFHSAQHKGDADRKKEAEAEPHEIFNGIGKQGGQGAEGEQDETSQGCFLSFAGLQFSLAVRQRF